MTILIDPVRTHAAATPARLAVGCAGTGSNVAMRVLDEVRGEWVSCGWLARFKVPKTVAITETIPRTASGKVRMHLLRDRALEEIQANAN